MSHARRPTAPRYEPPRASHIHRRRPLATAPHPSSHATRYTPQRTTAYRASHARRGTPRAATLHSQPRAVGCASVTAQRCDPRARNSPPHAADARHSPCAVAPPSGRAAHCDALRRVPQAKQRAPTRRRLRARPHQDAQPTSNPSSPLGAGHRRNALSTRAFQPPDRVPTDSRT